MKSKAINDLRDDGTALRAGFESMMSVCSLPGIGLEKPDFVRDWDRAMMDFFIMKDWVADLLALEKWFTSGFFSSGGGVMTPVVAVNTAHETPNPWPYPRDAARAEQGDHKPLLSMPDDQENAFLESEAADNWHGLGPDDDGLQLDKTSDVLKTSEVSTKSGGIKNLHDLAQDLNNNLISPELTEERLKTSKVLETSEASTAHFDKTAEVLETAEVSAASFDKTSGVLETSEVSAANEKSFLATMGQEMLKLYNKLSFDEAKQAVFASSPKNFSLSPDEQEIFAIDPSFQAFFGSEPQRTAEPIIDNDLINHQSDHKNRQIPPLPKGEIPSVAESRAENALITSSDLNNDGPGSSNDKSLHENLSVSVIPHEVKLPATAESASEPDQEFILKTIIKEVESDYRRHYGEL